MSCNYADGLSPYEHKGKLGVPEKFDDTDTVKEKVILLANWLKESKHVVLHTGAGISTPAGIPDFRGPKGVWTLEKQGLKPQINISFDDAEPTFTHMAILTLAKANHVHYVVSQNIDGLHLKSGLERAKLSELHGNMFIGQCSLCSRQYIRQKAVTTVGQRELSVSCPSVNKNPCRGRLHDTILDWEHELPVRDLGMADVHSSVADLSITLGTTMQIVPSGTLPLATKKKGGRLVIINLQPTKHDKKADLVINFYADDVMRMLMEQLDIKCIAYDSRNDPTRQKLSASEIWQDHFTKKEWTIGPRAVSTTRKRLVNTDNDNVDSKQKKPKANTSKRSKTQSNNDAETDSITCEQKCMDIKVNSIKSELVSSCDNIQKAYEHTADTTNLDLKKECSEETCQ